ncbi:PQQ-dependent dehydrogenase, methanol/ethanol family [Methylobacterium sp. J-043]|nr:PQQ-dependent dehydrogenase, methanol/ethanol family [Methylobacterium sp. J-043]
MSKTNRRTPPAQALAPLLGSALLAFAAVSGSQAAEGIKDYKPVTDERLANPEPENWLQYRGNYAGWGYSPLDKINAENVKRLVPAWTLSTGVMDGHQSPPTVNNGIMFISTPQAQVLAVNARDGQVLWRYQKDLPPELFQLHPTNRGVGLYGDKVYVATTDACVVALEAATGKAKWTKCVAKWKEGYYMTLSPLVAKGKVVVGVSGGEFGIRGFITALDAETGAEAWKTYTVAGPEDPGFQTWKGDSWKTGGSPVWIQGNYDPKSETAYFGTGNGGPWMPDTRPGDNLYSTSTVALDINTGKIKGHHQYHYNDAWDWDEVSAPLLIDIKRDGRTLPGLVHAGRNGYLWTLERTAEGPIKFVDAKPFVYQDVFSGVDPKTGRPTYKEDKVPTTGKKAEFCPSLWGGKDWPPEAYNPKTGLLYIPANDNLCAVIAGVPVKARKPGELYIGVPVEEILSSLHVRKDVDVSKPVNIGQLQAWDMNTGQKVWQHDFMDSATWGPVLTTGSGLVFTGGTSDRKFRAFDGKTGKVVWEMRLNSGVIGVPSSYMVDGVQYVAVQSGWGVDADRMLGGINNALPEDRRVRMAPQGGVVWVFKVMDQEVSAK